MGAKVTLKNGLKIRNAQTCASIGEQGFLPIMEAQAASSAGSVSRRQEDACNIEGYKRKLSSRRKFREISSSD